jgi:hypothetical protein
MTEYEQTMAQMISKMKYNIIFIRLFIHFLLYIINIDRNIYMTYFLVLMLV